MSTGKDGRPKELPTESSEPCGVRHQTSEILGRYCAVLVRFLDRLQMSVRRIILRTCVSEASDRYFPDASRSYAGALRMKIVLCQPDINAGRPVTVEARILGDPSTDSQLIILFCMGKEADTPIRSLVPPRQQGGLQIKFPGDREFSSWDVTERSLDNNDALNDSSITIVRR